MIYNKELIQDNLKEIWETISLSSFIEGKDWYWEAHKICQDIADEYNKPIEEVVGVCAALSPQKSWDENVKLVKNYMYDALSFKGHTGVMISKAHLIAMYTYFYKDRKAYIERILSGDKIVNFFNNILNPYDRSYVCIDRHHIQLATQDYKLTRITPKQYEFIKQETINFANEVNLIPCELQAILWTHFRKTKKGRI
jgi:hypothetical protein